MKIHVSVTAEDIASHRHSATDCPVAQAIKRAATEAGFTHAVVSVTHGHFSFYGGSRSWQQIRHDLVVADWIERYDAGLHVEPFEFDVEV